MTDDCTLLLNTYDGGEDLWEYFFRALNMQWPEMDLPIVINTESKKYKGNLYENVETFSLYKNGQKIPWGRRLKETLERIQTEFILFFLEDNWINRPVDDRFFRRTLEYIKEYDDIASIEFIKNEDPEHPNIQDGRFQEFALRPLKCQYKLNAQVALWRRKDLLLFTRDHETPWEWEIYGSTRIERFPHKKIYVLKEEETSPFSYIVDSDFGVSYDGMINMGKWNKDMVEYYSQIYDLSKINFSIRGYEDWSNYGNDKPLSIIERLTMPHVVRRLFKRFLVTPYRRWLSLKK